MSDTRTLYVDGKKVDIAIEAKPDPSDPGRWLLKGEDGKPLRGKLSLSEHAYNVVLSPDSFVIIQADEATLFQDSRSDDRVIFTLPSDNPDEFYVERYLSGAKGKAPHTVLILKYRETHKIISAALYPRDLENLPTPMYTTPAGKKVRVDTIRTDEMIDGIENKAGHAHDPSDLDFILTAAYQPEAIESERKVDLSAKKLDWF